MLFLRTSFGFFTTSGDCIPEYTIKFQIDTFTLLIKSLGKRKDKQTYRRTTKLSYKSIVFLFRYGTLKTSFLLLFAVDGSEVVDRGCKAITENETACSEFKTNDNCKACDTDGCNSAFTLKFSTGLVICTMSIIYAHRVDS